MLNRTFGERTLADFNEDEIDVLWAAASAARDEHPPPLPSASAAEQRPVGEDPFVATASVAAGSDGVDAAVAAGGDGADAAVAGAASAAQ
jgi:hypothetical protein